jgi:hypothetical protein
MVNKIVLMRHAEREDRALEAEGFDWILNALRPQDPLLSNSGWLIVLLPLNYKIYFIIYY